MAALHGFTLTGAQFAPLAGAGFRFHAPDLPGHGRTRIDPIDIPTTMSVLGQWLQSFDDPIPLLGYSQGGRIALLFALEYPSLVDRLVLVSASPGVRDAVDREARRRTDDALAVRIETIGLDAFLDDWSSNPITGTDHLDERAQRTDRAIRIENSATGLAAALRGLGQGSQPYVGDRLRELAVPLLTVSGRHDAKYESLAAEMAVAVPDGQHVSIDGAGHNVVLDAPEDLVATVAEFCGVGGR